jgi:ADP-dependent NAD(P)H-hydrate dehydratase / NAD(P)H-hydrate epimerase
MILLSAAESRELDRLSITTYGIDSYGLMTHAGEAVARAAKQHWPSAVAAGVLVVAGKGNNGGDGFVAARALRAEGTPVCVLLLARVADLKGDAARACAEYIAAGGDVVEGAHASALTAQRPGLLIDAIFGTGLNAEVRGSMRDVIEAINRLQVQLQVPVVTVDIASGINADTGAVMGVAIKAALTVTFGYAKYGHVSYPGVDYSGVLEIADIGFAVDALTTIAPRGRLIESREAAELIRPRAVNSHKGTYGHVLAVAGGRGKGGAAILVGRGALRAGAGLVTVAIPACVATVVAAGQAELMTEPLDDQDGHCAAGPTIERLRQLIAGKNALVAGPGMGASDDTQAVIDWLIREGTAPERPLLIDADGLNTLAPIDPALLKAARGPLVLTPHPGEMARLLGSTTSAVNADRIGAAQRLAALAGAHVLLKGARSVIVTRAGVVRINSSGNAGMATPGMGDVLSGIVGALMANGIEPGEALTLGVYAHGFAADCLAARIGHFGYLAGDLAGELPGAFTAIGG